MHYKQLRSARRRAAMRVSPDHSAWQATLGDGVES